MKDLEKKTKQELIELAELLERDVIKSSGEKTELEEKVKKLEKERDEYVVFCSELISKLGALPKVLEEEIDVEKEGEESVEVDKKFIHAIKVISDLLGFEVSKLIVTKK